MKIHELKIGDKIKFNPCGECTGKSVCYFCKPRVKSTGTVVATWLDFDIQTVEVQVKGSERLLEVSQCDLENPDFVVEVIKSSE